MLFNICPLAMRTQTILLVRDTVVMLDLRPTDGKVSLLSAPPAPIVLIALRGFQRSGLGSGDNRAIKW